MITWIGLMALLLACEEPDDDDTGSPGDEDIAPYLVNDGGCSDVWIYALSKDDTWAFWFQSNDGLVADAYAAGGPLSWTYDLSLPGVPEVGARFGSGLSWDFCNDVAGDADIVQEWRAESGTISLTITPTGKKTDWGEMPAEAVLVADGIFLVGDGAEPVEVSHLELTVSVGWLPG